MNKNRMLSYNHRFERVSVKTLSFPLVPLLVSCKNARVCLLLEQRTVPPFPFALPLSRYVTRCDSDKCLVIRPVCENVSWRFFRRVPNTEPIASPRFQPLGFLIKRSDRFETGW